MLLKELIEKNNKVYAVWERYVKENTLDTKHIRDIISDSWERSKTSGVNPFKEKVDSSLNHTLVSKEELRTRQKKCVILIDNAKPLMENLYKIVGDIGLIVRLTDVDGIVMECIHDDEMFNQFSNLNIFKGCNVSEEIIGTNAIGTSIKIGKPVQVLGAEHYCRQYHSWNSSACPIKNEKDEILGILSVTGIFEKVHPHTLGMVVAAAEAIENQLKLNLSNRQLTIANKHLHAIMESISEGLICTDKKGVVTDINRFARRKLQINENEIIGKNIDTIIDQKHKIEMNKVIKSGEKYYEQEISFLIRRKKKILCLIMTSPIIDISTEAIEGIVLVFREAKAVHNLVNKIIGAEAPFSFEDIIGTSNAIRNAIKVASKAAESETTILLKGESGTGKELFAQSIHNISNRRNRPFICLNVGAIPRELVASELFGYVEGAFTGARRGGHPGKFELADGGTIFLDEIGDMPLDVQVNLLRVLESREIVRLGGHDVTRVNVRVIAATHKNLEEAVSRGNFREDLYYRLNVVPIEIPPLRERKEDIRILVDYFLGRISARMGKEFNEISKSFYSSLADYRWPGNVRELQNIIHQVLNLLEDEKVLTEEHLPKHIKNIDIDTLESIKYKLLTLKDIEKLTIQRTIKQLEGNLTQTAKTLGISRSSLYRKMEQYNIDND